MWGKKKQKTLALGKERKKNYKLKITKKFKEMKRAVVEKAFWDKLTRRILWFLTRF